MLQFPNLSRVQWLIFVLATFVLPFALSITGQALAQSEPALDNSRILVTYLRPNSSYFMPIYKALRGRAFLESLKEFLSPLIIPPGTTLKISTKECGELNSWWSGRKDGLFLCYEWFDYALRIAPGYNGSGGMTREDAALGAFLQVTFHELGHAMFDIYEVPILGREEDAADQMAGLILTQFGPDIAKRTLPGTVYLWQSMADSEDDWGHDLFSDIHGHPLQRAYNYLCIAYGADPTTFQYVVDQGLLPKARAANCGREYRQIYHAFAATIFPHIDVEKMKTVRTMRWLRPEGGELPPR
jgi:hypothetical protein